MSFIIRGVLSRFAFVLIACTLPVAHADWQDWWQTPEQQAKAALDAGNADRLKQVAPDIQWQGVAEHESDEFDAAAKTFEQAARQLQQQGNDTGANQALYNKGVSEVRAGQYEQAVSTFDRVLEQTPDFADARHNRDIAKQLIQQQQQQQQQDGSEGDDSSQQETEQQGEQDQSSESSENASEASDSEQAEQGQQAQNQQPESGDGQQGDDADESAQSEQQEQQEQQEAQEALEAEAAEAENSDESNAQNGTPMQEREQPLSESDQATEQWLRRIPDDPAGLLRRKLEQSHQTEYPQVGNGRETW